MLTHTLTRKLSHTFSHVLSHPHTLSYTLSHIQSHTHTHTLSLIHTHSFSHDHTHTPTLLHSLSNAFSHILSHTHTHTLSLSHILSPSYTYIHSLTYTHTQAHTLSYTDMFSISHIHAHTLSQTYTLSLKHPFSTYTQTQVHIPCHIQKKLSLTHTYHLTNFLTHSHTHAHSHTHTHTLRCTHPFHHREALSAQETCLKQWRMTGIPCALAVCHKHVTLLNKPRSLVQHQILYKTPFPIFSRPPTFQATCVRPNTAFLWESVASPLELPRTNGIFQWTGLPEVNRVLG